MRVAPQIELTDAERAELTKLARSKRTSVRLAQRAHIVLLAAQGLQNTDIATQVGVGRVQVSRWRGRYAQSRLADIDRETPKGKTLHLIADNYATHKHPNVQKWLEKHPRFNMHFTPTSASWLNRVERFFRDISENRLRRGVFTSVPELVAAIDEYVARHNTKPKPFIWTASACDILQKGIRANSRLSSKQNATLH